MVFVPECFDEFVAEPVGQREELLVEQDLSARDALSDLHVPDRHSPRFMQLAFMQFNQYFEENVDLMVVVDVDALHHIAHVVLPNPA